MALGRMALCNTRRSNGVATAVARSHAEETVQVGALGEAPNVHGVLSPTQTRRTAEAHLCMVEAGRDEAGLGLDDVMARRGLDVAAAAAGVGGRGVIGGRLWLGWQGAVMNGQAQSGGVAPGRSEQQEAGAEWLRGRPTTAATPRRVAAGAHWVAARRIAARWLGNGGGQHGCTAKQRCEASWAPWWCSS